MMRQYKLFKYIFLVHITLLIICLGFYDVCHNYNFFDLQYKFCNIFNNKLIS